MDQETTENARQKLVSALDTLTAVFSPDMWDEGLSQSERIAQVFSFESSYVSGTLHVGTVYEMHVHVVVRPNCPPAVMLCTPALSKGTAVAGMALATDLRTACEAASQMEVILADLLSEMSQEEAAAAISAQHEQAERPSDANELN